MHLLRDNTVSAMSQLNKHISSFRGLSNARNTGEDSFEFWTWLSKQYRAFGDLVDIATRHGFKIPDPSVTAAPSLQQSDYRYGASFVVGTSTASGESSGLNPRMVLQHAGFYYQMAAMCNSERRKRFLAIDKVSTSNSADSALF
jgi:hypothetical protein